MASDAKRSGWWYRFRGWWYRFRELVKFAFRNPSVLLNLGAIVVVALALFGLFHLTFPNALDWGFGVGTFLAVQVFENRRQWIESLPKYVTVHFWKYEDGRWEVQATWEMAYLAGVQAMRETIQQLGRQMHGDLLALEGFMLVEDENPKPVWGRGGVQVGKEGASEGWYRHYVVHFPYLGRMKDQENPEPVLYSSTEDSVKRTPDWNQIGSFQEAVNERRRNAVS